jgi:hypothetical protein
LNKFFFSFVDQTAQVTVTDGSARVLNFQLKSNKDSHSKAIHFKSYGTSNTIFIISAIALSISIVLMLFALYYSKRCYDIIFNWKHNKYIPANVDSNTDDELFLTARYTKNLVNNL